MKYGFADTTKKNISDSVDSFFELLIIFVSNADLENKIDNNDTNEINIEDNEDIKNNADMTYEKFVNEILDYAKEVYFAGEKNFNWVDNFNKCPNGTELKKILSEKNIDIPELQQNKLKNENKLDKNIGKRNDEKIKNINFQLNHQVQIANQNKSKKNENEINEKNNETDITINNKSNLKTKLELISSIKNITNSTGNKSNNTSKTYQKIDAANSKQKDLQNKYSETALMPTAKISYRDLIAKIVLYVLAVVAFVVLIFSIIKAFWFLAILSFILCLVFTFVALNIKHKTINKQLENISTGYLNYLLDIVKPGKNNKLEEVPKINDGAIWKRSHKNQI